MSITTRDGLIAALSANNSVSVIDKASLSNTAAGNLFSLWTASGVPASGAAPSTTPAVLTSAAVGAIPFANQTDPQKSYLAWASLGFSNVASSVEFCDRLAAVAGASGVLTTSQTTGCALDLASTAPSAERIGAADYSGVSWFIEVYTPLGATAVNATANVTYHDGSTGDLAPVALGATPRAGRLYPLLPAVAGENIRAVNSVTLSTTTGTAGNFGITAMRRLTALAGPAANVLYTADWAQLGLPQVANDACLQLVMLCSASNTGTVRGQVKIAHG